MTECWLYAGPKTDKGYGQFKGGRIHRFAYEYWNGSIPTGLFVLHKCDNPPCFNPDHLFLGTAKDNTDDMMNKGRWRGQELHYNTVKTHCKNGHEYTPENTQVRTFYGRRSRRCITCHRIDALKRHHLQKVKSEQ